jgi:hypothetical protein
MKVVRRHFGWCWAACRFDLIAELSRTHLPGSRSRVSRRGPLSSAQRLYDPSLGVSLNPGIDTHTAHIPREVGMASKGLCAARPLEQQGSP